MGKKGPLWWRESDWLLRGSSAANQILLRHSGPILSERSKFLLTTGNLFEFLQFVDNSIIVYYFSSVLK